MIATPPRRLFTVDDFHRMIEAGVFHEEDRVELVDGEVVEMAAIGPAHAASVRKLNRLFSARVGQGAIVDVQNPIILSERRELYPDVLLLAFRGDFYADAIPQAKDVLLVVEVSDSTLLYDRQVKLPRYAAAGIPEVWIIDLNGKRIWVYRRPLEGVYGEVQEAAVGDTLTVLALPEVRLAVADIL